MQLLMICCILPQVKEVTTMHFIERIAVTLLLSIISVCVKFCAKIILYIFFIYLIF